VIQFIRNAASDMSAEIDPKVARRPSPKVEARRDAQEQVRIALHLSIESGRT
jgi:hypothetical protein